MLVEVTAIWLHEGRRFAYMLTDLSAKHLSTTIAFQIGFRVYFGFLGAGLLRRRNLNTEVSLWECIKCFPSTIRRKDLRKGQSTVILGLDRNLRPCRQFKSRATFSKRFPSTRKREAAVFKFLRLGELFRKAPFSWRISVDGRLNRRNKAAYPNSSGVKRTGS